MEATHKNASNSGNAGLDLPPDWEPWKTTAAFERAYGKSYAAIAAMVGKCAPVVTAFLCTPECERIIRRIRREAGSLIYGASLNMTTVAMDNLREILEDPETDANTMLKAIELVRKLNGDSTQANAAAEVRALRRDLKRGRK
jgi:hypothetical protein